MKNIKELLTTLLSKDKFWLAAVFLVTFAVFLPAVKFTNLIADDTFYYLRTLALRDSSPGLREALLSLNTPLTSLSFYADLLLWGEKNFIRGAHFTNILLHCGTAVLFYLLLRSLKWAGQGLTPAWAGMAALIFALHPQRVEAVVWFCERKDCLAMFTGVGAFLVFLWEMRRERLPLLSGLLLVLSLLSGSMWLFFFVPAAALLWIERRSFEWKLYLKQLSIPFAVFAAWMAFQLPEAAANCPPIPLMAEAIFYKAESILFNYGNYFLRTFIPGNLYPLYPPYNPAADPRWMALIPIGLIVIPCILLKEKACRSAILYGVLPVVVSFIFILIPVAGFFSGGMTDFADRYSYLPALFLVAGSAFLLKLNIPIESAFGRWLPVLGVLYCGGLGYKAELYIPCWENKTAFNQKSMNLRYPHIRTVMSAAIGHFDRGEYDKALKVTEEKLPVLPHYTPLEKKTVTLFRLSLQGMILCKQKKADEGVLLLDRVFSQGNDDLQSFFPDKFGERVSGCYEQLQKERNARNNLNHTVKTIKEQKK